MERTPVPARSVVDRRLRTPFALGMLLLAPFALVGLAPTAAACTVNIGYCNGGTCEVNTAYCSGDCEINLGYCGTTGQCTVNTGYCTWTCTINVRTCTPPPTVAGTIALPVGDNPRLHRCAYNAQGNDAQGVFGWTVIVTPGLPFTLNAVGTDAPLQDFNIAFYSSLAPCSTDPAPDGVGQTVGNEFGVVPFSSTVAIVYLFSGSGGNFEFAQ